MLGTRLVIGISMAVILTALLLVDDWLAPWFPLWLVLCLVALGSAALELSNLLEQTSAKPSGNTVFAGVLVMVLANWAPHIIAKLHELPHMVGRLPYDPLSPVNALAWPFMTFTALVMATFVAQSAQFEKPGATMATISGTILALAYIGALSSFIIQMRWFEGRFHGFVALAYLVATSKGSDTGAYTFGRLAGRHKLWPRLSPNKTIEGAIGGLISGVGFATIVTAVGRYLLHVPTLGMKGTVAFGLIVGAAAQLGDLMESMIKRDCARKDASSVVPGFGGVLDVLDSLLFAGPVAFGFWLWAGF